MHRTTWHMKLGSYYTEQILEVTVMQDTLEPESALLFLLAEQRKAFDCNNGFETMK